MKTDGARSRGWSRIGGRIAYAVAALALLPIGMAAGPTTQDRPYLRPPVVIHAAMLRTAVSADASPDLALSQAATDASYAAQPVRVAASLRRLVQPAEDYQPDPVPLPPPPPEVEVYVDISDQRLTLLVDGAQIARWRVSTGRRGHYTPTGVFTPFFLSRHHRSSIYNNAPMPYSVFFNGNIAIHGTNMVSQLGRRASHGCVRLHPSHARQLFDLVRRRGRDKVMIAVQH